FAVQNDQIYVIEANPRASRTVPFVSKAVGVPLAKLATKVALGKSIKDLIKGYNIQVFENIGDSIIYETQSKMYAIKESVFPWNRFPQEDPILGPEMKSTGEVMGIDKDLGLAFYKSQLAAGFKLPKSGTVFISVKDKDKPKVINIAKKLVDLGFKLVATQGTYKFLKEHGIEVEKVYKVYEGQRPNILDLIKNKEIHLIINTPSGKTAQKDAISIRRLAVNYNIPYYTTIRSAQMVVLAIESLKTKKLKVYALQDINKS
ncbi:MAG TPA: carbamoyl phosphate synthase large subunit, partial [Desulfurobacteriaceae bacterium]|nr:carbamoyl phosphate synthase large subunit [Desulfurobacteriaceae bacterium]